MAGSRREKGTLMEVAVNNKQLAWAGVEGEDMEVISLKNLEI